MVVWESIFFNQAVTWLEITRLWAVLVDDFIREFDAVDLSAKSKRKSAKATNLKDSQYVVALHRDSKTPMPTADNTPKIRNVDFYTDEFHHYPVDIPQNCLDVIDKNIALDADNVFAKIGGRCYKSH